MQDSWNRQVVGIILRQQRGERAASAPERAKRPAELDDHEKSEKCIGGKQRLVMSSKISSCQCVQLNTTINLF